MNFIRQNTPFVLVWEIELQGTAIKLADTKVSVIASCARGRIDLTDYIDSIEDNTITINQNKGLAFIGDYSLMAIIKSENLTTLKVQEKYVFRAIAKNDPTETESLVSIRSSIVASGGYDSALSEVSQNAIQNAPVAKEFGKVYQAIEDTESLIKQSVEDVLGGASEAYDTLKEIEDYIEKDEAGAVALAKSIARLETEKVSKEDIDSALSTTSENPVQNKVVTEELGKKATTSALSTLETKVDTKLTELSEEIEEIKENQGSGNSPIGYGDATHSAVLKGEYQGYSNKALSQTSMAIGAATTAGLKGWYYSAIDFTNETITLSDRPTYILAGSTLIGGGWSSGAPNIDVDDVISLVNDSKYDLCSKVTAVNGNVITVDSLPFARLVRDDGAAAAVLAGQFSDGYSIYIPERPDAGLIDFGGGAFSEGGQSKASNICAHAEGLQTHAYGQYSHTEGRETKAGYAAHAEGRRNEASGTMSHAEGQSTLAIGSKSHTEGTQTETHANNSHAEGYKSIVKDGAGAHAEGYGSVIDFTESTEPSDIPSNANREQSIGAHVEGVNNTAAGIAVHVEGKNNKANRIASHAEGVNTRAGVFEASNEDTTATEGLFTHAEGNSTLARGSASHAEGAATQSLGRASHAEGRHSVAKGNYSHAEGFDTFAGANGGNLLPSITSTSKGYFTHAEGHNTLAEGNSSHAEGKGTKAVGDVSHAEGYGTIAKNPYEHASGKYNKSTSSTNDGTATIFSVGIGTSDSDRKNAFEVRRNGDFWIAGIYKPLQSVLESFAVYPLYLNLPEEFSFDTLIPIEDSWVLGIVSEIFSSEPSFCELGIRKYNGGTYAALCVGGEIVYGDEGSSISFFTADGKYSFSLYYYYTEEHPYMYYYKIKELTSNTIV